MSYGFFSKADYDYAMDDDHYESGTKATVTWQGVDEKAYRLTRVGTTPETRPGSDEVLIAEVTQPLTYRCGDLTPAGRAFERVAGDMRSAYDNTETVLAAKKNGAAPQLTATSTPKPSGM